MRQGKIGLIKITSLKYVSIIALLILTALLGLGCETSALN